MSPQMIQTSGQLCSLRNSCSYLDKILSRSGGAKALELFKDFMGWEPQIEALLIQIGIPTNRVQFVTICS